MPTPSSPRRMRVRAVTLLTALAAGSGVLSVAPAEAAVPVRCAYPLTTSQVATWRCYPSPCWPAYPTGTVGTTVCWPRLT